MELFRITRSEYQNDLSGMGAYYHGGRWNSPRNAMVYSCSRRSLAMLEILVHLQRPTPPPDYVVVVIYVPDAMKFAKGIYVIPDWQLEPQWTRETGDTWLQEKSSLLLRVPSVVVRNESNYLINPNHPEAESVKVINIEPFEFDSRLFRAG
ncbi:RES family NAD+ phosphorylase [Dyadobacter sp. CY312]|uniref:RES family NAD+ phosphorylase n=1 Tax=Dyadobacter sp. CY312 TaxID=2907303 RepID=UPI001F2E8F6C|nr:RES family NAD+ phosphorylase [Dyadobacter sp. CY312]MCE7039384.1 RES family NAD+ phosphorylase [Dyadobacter sp. CY312]